MRTPTPADDAQAGIDQPTLRRVLKEAPSSDLVSFLLKGARENKAFRRKVLAWLIDSYADQLAPEAVGAEVARWVEDVFDSGRSDFPRVRALRDLAPVRTAVRHHPGLAVPAHLAVVDAIASWLDAYGDGPDSLYQALIRHFEWAVAALPLVRDEQARFDALIALEDAVVQASDFGYGLDRMTADTLSSVADHFPGRAFDFGSILERHMERRRRRRRPGQPGRAWPPCGPSPPPRKRRWTRSSAAVERFLRGTRLRARGRCRATMSGSFGLGPTCGWPPSPTLRPSWPGVGTADHVGLFLLPTRPSPPTGALAGWPTPSRSAAVSSLAR